MNPLTLRLKSQPASGLRLNMYGITPCRLAQLEVREIENIELSDGIESTPLKNWFHVRDGAREEMIVEGDCSRCDNLGGGLTKGSMRILGSAGDHLAHDMKNGSLTVSGSVGAFAGSNLQGGYVRVEGNAGEYLAGAIPGKRFGMRGGSMTVQGNAGRWAAARMRRGTLVVHGKLGDGLAMRMIAGSVVCCAQISSLSGCGMKRGSLFVLRPQSTLDDIPGFSPFDTQELGFLPMFLKSLRNCLPEDLGSAYGSEVSPLVKRARRAIGDRCCGGLGEIILCDCQSM